MKLNIKHTKKLGLAMVVAEYTTDSGTVIMSTTAFSEQGARAQLAVKIQGKHNSNNVNRDFV